MNKERMLEAADYIDATEHHSKRDNTKRRKGSLWFNLFIWRKETATCGTTGCIAGHISGIIPKNKKIMYDNHQRTGMVRNLSPFYSREGRYSQRWLGLTSKQATDLFVPPFHKWEIPGYECRASDRGYAYRKVTPTQAAEVMRLMVHGVRTKKAWEIVLKDLPRPEGFTNGKSQELKELEELRDSIDQLQLLPNIEQKVTT